MKCRIDKGARKVFAPNNRESELFNQLYYIVGDFQTALDTYAIVETADFKRYSDLVIDKSSYDHNGEPDIETFMRYVNSQGESTLTKSEVIDFMESSGVYDSAELLKELSKLEVLGFLDFSLTNLRKSKLFTTFEAEKISGDLELQNSVRQVLKFLRTNDDFTITPTSYITNGGIGKVGKRTVEKDLGEDGVVEVGLKRTSTALTIDRSPNPPLSRDIAFLVTGVAESTWESMSEAVKNVIRAIEKKALDMGIDVRGIADSFENKDREDILDMVDAVDAVLAEEITTEQFDLVREEFFQEGTKEETRILTEYDTVIKEDISEDQAYEQGMIRISEDVYRQVEIVPFEELVEIQAEIEGVSAEEIIQEVNRNYDRSLQNGREIYLTKKNLGVSTFIPRTNTTQLEAFSGDFEYLTGPFVRDFMKVADMAYFDIDFKGITFKQGVQPEKALSTLDSETLSNLEQYSLISPYINMPYPVEGFNNMVDGALDRMKNLMNPNLAPKYNGEFFAAGDAVAIRNRTEQFLNIQGALHELVNKDQNISYYKPVSDFNKPVMESNPNDFTALRVGVKESKIKRSRHFNKVKENNFNC